MCWKTGWERSKCCWGGSHQSPGGQKLVAVTTMVPGRHHCRSFTHLSSKQAPQLRPLVRRVVLNAAVLVPYPWLYRFPYSQAPPIVPEASPPPTWALILFLIHTAMSSPASCLDPTRSNFDLSPKVLPIISSCHCPTLKSTFWGSGRVSM